MPAVAQGFHAQVVRTQECKKAEQFFIGKGRAFTEGYLHAHRGWTLAKFFKYPEYVGAKMALAAFTD